MTTESTIHIHAETTPNPHTLRFVVNRELVGFGTVNFRESSEALRSPLAKALFEISGVCGVLIGQGFVTVTKTSESLWSELAEPCTRVLRTVLETVEDVVGAPAAGSAAPIQMGESNDPISLKIQEILNTEVRPAVAMDGGDIIFYGYKDGIVSLHLQGSCSSCPSSVLTLKMGVESRLKMLIPEVKEVIQV
jgi:Fe-S cluster biogenesis protein NfuA